MAAKRDFTVLQGKTFSVVLRWESEPYIYVPITSITAAAPAVITTAAPHGLPDGWRIAVVSCKGMTDINAKNNPPKQNEYVKATVTGPSELTLNAVNSADYKAHTASTGYVQALTPVDLTGYTARMKIKDRVGGTVLASTEGTDAPLNVIITTVDSGNATITVEIDADSTAAFAWTKGVYDLEMVSPTSTVTALLFGSISVSKEVTA